jgi:hypothetical protein
MTDWNEIITVDHDGRRRAPQKFGEVERSPSRNASVTKVDDPLALLEAVDRRTTRPDRMSSATSMQCCLASRAVPERPATSPSTIRAQ